MQVLEKPVTEISESDVVEFSRRRGEPEWVLRIRLRALRYLKETPPDPMVDGFMERVVFSRILEGYEDPLLDPEEAVKAARQLGVPEEEIEVIASGFALDVDNRVVRAINRYLQSRGVILEPMEEAVRRHEDLVKRYAFKGLEPTLNRRTAYHALLWSGGPFIYVPRGVRIPQPLLGLFVIGREGLGQTEHTLIVVEEGGYLEWVEGCSVPLPVKYSVHLGGLEAFVGPRASLRVVSINNWLGDVVHMPVKRVRVSEAGRAEMTSISFRSTVTLTSPRLELEGRGSTGVIQNIGLYGESQRVYGSPLLVMHKPSTSGQILNRTVVKDEAYEEFRGTLKALRGAKGASGFMSCNTLIIGEKARSVTVPALDSEEKDVDLAHEASVGRVSAEKLYYMALMGFDEEEATWLIVNGFFDPVVSKLPYDVQVEVRRIIELALTAH